MASPLDKIGPDRHEGAKLPDFAHALRRHLRPHRGQRLLFPAADAGADARPRRLLLRQVIMVRTNGIEPKDTRWGRDARQDRQLFPKLYEPIEAPAFLPALCISPSLMPKIGHHLADIYRYPQKRPPTTAITYDLLY